MTRVRIESIAGGGAGVGRLPDGLTVFVPRTAPGDLVEVAVCQRKRRYARGRLVALCEGGTGRVQPPCRHYTEDGCGGCQLQHLTTDVQRDVKRKVVGEAVRRIGGLCIPDPEIVAAPAAWRYRAKITLAARGSRIGLHQHDRPGHVFQLVDCPITRESLMTVWRTVARHRDLLPRLFTRLVLREDRTGHIHLVLEGAGSGIWDAGPLAEAVRDPDLSIWWKPRGRSPRVVAGPDRGMPAWVFEQINPTLADRIRADAVAFLRPETAERVWDLYGGVGDTTMLLAARGAEVWMVDRDRSAVAWAGRREVGSTGGRPRLTVASVEESVESLPEPDAVIVNPPRHGLHRRVAQRLARWGASRAGARLAYVSCDPATLARDLARLPAFRLARLTGYDLFPQTSHVETLALLEVP